MFEEVPLNLSFCDRGSAIFYVHSYIYSYIIFFFCFSLLWSIWFKRKSRVYRGLERIFRAWFSLIPLCGHP